MSTPNTRAMTAHTYSRLVGLAVAALSLGACGGRVQYQEPPKPVACDYPTNIKHGDRCIDVLSDNQHCGARDKACPEGQFCVEGTCASECGKLTPTQCGDQCVNLRTNSDHCGDCGHECKGDQVCSGGVCADNCGADTPYTCGDLCVNQQTDKFHCGKCGRACKDDQLCVEGRCTYDCDGTKTTECHQTCIDPRTDPRFCGGCDAACASGERCQDGTCASSCAAPTPADCNGICADLQWDPDACGKCGVMCGPDSVCNDGQCANNCSGSREKCDDRCVDLLVDPYHCGECDNTCALDQVCSAGKCEAECGGETPLRCGNRCLRLAGANSGDAGIGDGGVGPNASTDGGMFADLGNGDCRLICPESAPDLCPTGCVDQATDVRHCGECGRSCDDGQVCTFGVCETSNRDAGETSDNGVTSEVTSETTFPSEMTTIEVDIPTGELLTSGREQTTAMADASLPSLEDSLPPDDIGLWGLSLSERTSTVPSRPFSGCAELDWLDDQLVVRDLSLDGNTLVGNAAYGSSSSERFGWGFRWSRQQPVEWIGRDFLASSASSDGSTIAGETVALGASLWRATAGMTALDPQGSLLPKAIAMTSDGAFLVGSVVGSVSPEPRSGPFRWSAEVGFEWLPAVVLSEMGPRAWNPAAISDDGKTIVGTVGPWSPNVATAGVFWREGSELQIRLAGNVRSLSRDGSVAVGDDAVPVSPSNGVMWFLTDTVSESVVLPPTVGSNRASGTASLVNHDGTIVFGMTRNTGLEQEANPIEPYVWSEQAGTRLLADILADSCVDVSTISWDEQWEVKAISEDNKVIVVCSNSDYAARPCWLAQWS